MEATAPYHGESLDPIVQGHRSRIYSYDRVATSKIVEWCCYLFIPVVTSLWANSERWCMQRSENYDRELTLFIKATVRLSVDLDHWSHSFLMMFLPIRDSANFWTRVNSVMYVVKKKKLKGLLDLETFEVNYRSAPLSIFLLPGWESQNNLSSLSSSLVDSDRWLTTNDCRLEST